MKKITFLLILFLISKINNAQLIYDKWPQVYSYTTSVTNKINNIYQLNLQKPKYNLNPSTRGGGDLSNFLKINNILHHVIQEYS